MKQHSLFSKEAQSKHIFNLPDAEVFLIPSFFDEQESSAYFKELQENIDWQQDELKMFGKVFKLPRLTAWYGDAGKSYSYSGIKMKPKPWTKTLLLIKTKLEKETQLSYNSCLLNLYRDGTNSMGWHQDNEKELGRNPSIASISFGAERKFHLKHISRKDIKTLSIGLEDGSLLFMGGATQHNYKHQIPKTKKPIGVRINLTFRSIN